MLRQGLSSNLSRVQWFSPQRSHRRPSRSREMSQARTVNLPKMPRSGSSKRSAKSRRSSAARIPTAITQPRCREVYKMSLAAAGVSITVKATGLNSGIDFDLRLSAEKKIKHYVWVGRETGSHLPGRWIEASIRPGPSPAP
jgi:hypothetical protein